MVFSNKMRLVVDASCHLNPYVSKDKTKLDSLDNLTCIVSKEEFGMVDNFNSGRFHRMLEQKAQFLKLFK